MTRYLYQVYPLSNPVKMGIKEKLPYYYLPSMGRLLELEVVPMPINSYNECLLLRLLLTHRHFNQCPLARNSIAYLHI